MNIVVGFEDCNGYNTTLGGEGVNGWKRSPEIIESHRQQMTGRKQTPEHVEKRVKNGIKNGNYGKGMKGQNHSLESLSKMSDAQKGKPKSEAHKQAMRLRPQDTKLITCPHCGKTGDYKNMNRWHLDRCKQNPTRKNDLEKTVTCSVCGYTAKQSPNFYRRHNSNCSGSKLTNNQLYVTI